MLLWKQRRVVLVLSTVIIALTWLIINGLGGFQALELLIYDQLWTRKAIHQWDERIILVGYSTEDVAKFGDQPSDELLRQVLEKVDRGHPTTVGLMYHRFGKGQNSQEREGLIRQIDSMAPRLVRSTIKDEYLSEPDSIMRRLALYRDNDYYHSPSPDRWIAWNIAHHFLFSQGAKVKEPSSVYGATTIIFSTGDTVKFFPLSPSRDGGYQASTKNLSRYQVLLSFPQALPETVYNFEGILNEKFVDFNNKIVIIGQLTNTNKFFARTPMYQYKEPYAYLYDSLFTALGVSNFLQLPQAPFVAVWSEGTEFLYLLAWLIISSLFILFLSIDLRLKYGWVIFLVGVIVTWFSVMLGIFLVSFSVFPKIWIPCGWIMAGTSANIVIGAFATLELAVRDEQLLVLIEQKKVFAEQTKRLRQEELYNQRLNQEIETLKNTLLAQERLAFIGRLAPFLRHKILNLHDDLNLNFTANELDLKDLEDSVNEILDILTDIVEDEEQEEIDKNKEKILDLIQAFSRRFLAQRRVFNRTKELLDRFLPMIRAEQTDHLQPQWLNINLLISESSRISRFDFKNLHQDLHVELLLELSEEIPLIYGITTELQFALVNVIENAYYAVWEKSRTDEPNYIPMITIRSQLSQECIKIFIEDNGVGIGAELTQEVFKPFYSTKKRLQETSGVGLTLTKDILKQHYNGQIYLQPQDGVTCFVIELPYGTQE